MSATRDMVWDEFAQAASDYCVLVQEGHQMALSSVLPRLAASLALLYAKAVVLPEIAPISFAGIQHPDPEGENLRESWADRLGGRRWYRTVFDPFDERGGVVHGDLANDFVSTYRDLRPVADAFRPPDGPTDLVVWEAMITFRAHWSQHLVDALKAVDSLLHRHGV